MGKIVSMVRCYQVEVVMHDHETCPDYPDSVQGKFLVHGLDDVMWTDSIDDALQFLRQDLERIVEYRKSHS